MSIPLILSRFVVVVRAFSDGDFAKIKCPDDRKLIIHNQIAYGRLDGNCSNVNVGKMNRFCNGIECNIEVTAEKLGITTDPCPGKTKELIFKYSCQMSKVFFRK